MIILREGERAPGDQPSVVAVGVFDGLHLGHQQVLGEVKALALERSALSTVVTFDAHPALVLAPASAPFQVRAVAVELSALSAVVPFDPPPALLLAPESAPLQLGTLEQRLEGFAALGIDQVRILRFDAELAQQTARSFIERVLVGELRTCDVVVGEDFHFGHDRQGNVALLKSEGSTRGFAVHPAPIYGGNQRWSSTAVRNALGSGDLFTANALLGRPFTLRGSVVHGDARGGELGYRTADSALEAREPLR